MKQEDQQPMYYQDPGENETDISSDGAEGDGDGDSDKSSQVVPVEEIKSKDEEEDEDKIKEERLAVKKVQA